MLVTRKSFIFNCPTSYPSVRRNGRKFGISMAKKRDLSDKSRTQQETTIFPLKISNPILARSVVAVLGLGFIDAGYAFLYFLRFFFFFFFSLYLSFSCKRISMFRYSGDWSRIGVISKETEDLLKLAAFVLVPFCIFLIFSLSRETEA
jgi:hypothetical protein